LIESRRATSGGAWMREPAKPAPAEPGWRVARSGVHRGKGRPPPSKKPTGSSLTTTGCFNSIHSARTLSHQETQNKKFPTYIENLHRPS
ncbi:MAG: hypothetical protein ACXVCN_16570, partial [Bdellovibrio sp.]